MALQAEGVDVAEPINLSGRAYDQKWDFTNPATEARFVWLVRRVIDPLGIHFSLPAGKCRARCLKKLAGA